jgi:uncharacterized protein (DUF433 family)
MPQTLTEIGTLIARDPAIHAGRPLIAGVGVSVRAIAIDSNSGLAPEEIASDRPGPSLAQVYAGMADHHASQPEIDADIEAEARAYDEGAAQSGSSQSFK